ncbi:MAG TPA: hypothetical protein DDZ88_23685 [Verrucomicrobiales bacterium]|nr:hypothetical protein [Verrucomicrobiales bacterium]
MSLQQLSTKLRLIRSQMPRVTSERAYAQMDHLMGRTISSDSRSSEQTHPLPLCSSAPLRQK